MSKWLYFNRRKEPCTDIPIVEVAFSALNDDRLFDAAADLVCEIISWSCTAGRTFLISTVCHRLLGLTLFIEKCVQAEDYEKMMRLSVIFVEAIEGYFNFITDDLTCMESFLRILLIFTRLDDLSIVSQTIPGWLSAMTDLPEKYWHSACITEIIGNLISFIVKHLAFPSNELIETAVKKDEFRDFRHDIGEVLKNCCAIIGSSKALSVPLHMLMDTIQKGSKWQEIEAAIFAFRTMAAEIDCKEEAVMGKIVQLLLSLPENIFQISRVRYSSVLALGAFCEWLKLHPVFIAPSVQVIFKSMAFPDTLAASILALKHISQTCSKVGCF